MISNKIKEIIESPSNGVIRKMFEEGVVLKKKYGEDNVYDFSLGNPDLDPPKEVLDAIKEVAQDTSHMCHGYMPNAGYSEARMAMAEKTSLEQGVDVFAENIVMSVGAAAALGIMEATKVKSKTARALGMVTGIITVKKILKMV